MLAQLILQLALGCLGFGCLIWFILRFFSTRQAIASEEQLRTGQKPRKTSKKEIVTAQEFLGFEDIKHDMLVLPGHRYRAIIEVAGVNYWLRSEVEQARIDAGFASLLSSISYPIQFYVQSRRVDLHENFRKYDANLKKSSEVMQAYGYTVMQFVGELAQRADVLEKRNYVIIPYNHVQESGKGSMLKDEIVRQARAELSTRAGMVADGLIRAGLDARMLNDNEIAELVYVAFNRQRATVARVDQADEGEFFALNVTRGRKEDRCSEVAD